MYLDQMPCVGIEPRVGAPPQSYCKLLSSMYPKGDSNLQSIVAEVLQASDPIADEDIFSKVDRLSRDLN